MADYPQNLIQRCKLCSGTLAPDALVCPLCHSLVHAEELEKLAAGAKALEQMGDLPRAQQTWSKALELLPQHSSQGEWIRNHTRHLAAASTSSATNQSKYKWAQKLGPLAPIAIALTKGKALLAIFKLQFFLSLAAFMGFYWTIFGAKFGFGFVSLILIHEMGHYVDIKRRGLPAEMPVFLPGLGAYVRWHALGVPVETRAAVSLAGPLAGWIASAVCVLIWWKTGNGIWAALARVGAWLNVLNLIPVWALDGGQAALALNRSERIVLLTACVALWLLMGENLFFLVALGAVWRLFTKDMPPQPSPATTAYFVGVLASLALVLKLIPGQGFGIR